MNTRHGLARVGRMPRWQRLASYFVLGACAISGLGWFVGLDLMAAMPPQLKLWWVSHGVLGFLTLFILGAAVPPHVLPTWRHRRNLPLGLAFLAIAAALSLTALWLLYGPGEGRDIVHWAHALLGLAASALFIAHVLRGRRSVGRAVRPRPSAPR